MRNFGTIFIKTIQEFRQGVNRREKHPHFLKIGWGSTAVRLPHSWITGMIFLRRADRLGNIEAWEKIRNALVGVPEADKSYERTLELIDILKEEKSSGTD